MRKSLPLTLLTGWLLSVGYGHTVAQTLAFARSVQQMDIPQSTKNGIITAHQPLKQTLLQLKEYYGVDILFEESVVAKRVSPLEPLSLTARLETNLNLILKPYGLRF